MLHARPLLGQPHREDRPYLAINMVATVDGRAALNGSAVGIGSETDKRLMRELRAEADAVLHGASTVRADPLSARVPPDLVEQRLSAGLTAQPLGVIITRSGNLPHSHPYFESAALVCVLSEASVSISRPGVEVWHTHSIADVLFDLRRRGVRRVVCEGGPTLNAGLFEAGLVDEMYLTVSPKLVGGEHPLTLIKGGQFDGGITLELRSLVQLEGELFIKYGVLGSQSAV